MCPERVRRRHGGRCRGGRRLQAGTSSLRGSCCLRRRIRTLLWLHRVVIAERDSPDSVVASGTRVVGLQLVGLICGYFYRLLSDGAR